jgi:uncharacterized protein YecE (DUF72 family)
LRVWIGTSGWQYRDWRDAFYPHKLPQREWLVHYAEQFGCVEVNNTFYNLPSEDAVRRWHDETPKDFQFILKASRYLTHIRRLNEPRQPVDMMMERFRPLGRRMAVILLQLPPTFSLDLHRLETVLRTFPARVRIAVEFRHESWFTDDVRAVLREHDAALCMTDRNAETAEPDWDDLSWSYVRFHEGDGRPHPCYRAATLSAWADRIAAKRDTTETVYVFFNNDMRCCAPRDAAVLARACRERRLDVSRAPEPSSIRPV